MFRVLGFVVLTLVALIVGLLLYAGSRWDEGTRRLRDRLESARMPITPTRYNPDDLGAVPAPVRRYFTTVLGPGMPMITVARLAQRGTFNLSDSSQRWVEFRSDQEVVTRRPGFDWDARMRMAPAITMRVHDAYVAGEGQLHAALLGVFPVMTVRGTRAIAEGELMRFLAESPWYPTALLPSQGVQWDSLDAHSARATLADGDVSASLVFHFGDDGLIESVRTERRMRLVAGREEPTPWLGRWSDWRWWNNVMVPARGEVAWLLPEGALPYWRGELIALGYERME